MNTSDLSGTALDWAVAQAEGIEVRMPLLILPDGDWWYPSIDWAQGGPIIERQKIDVMWGGDRWCAYTMTPDGEVQLQTEGPTPLIAAMRGYVASKLGFEVEVN